MLPTVRDSGQEWSLLPLNDGKGGVMFVNDFTGTKKRLDVYKDSHEGFLGGGDHLGQHWRYKKIKKI